MYLKGCVAVFALGAKAQCPPENFDTQAALGGGGFDLTWYTSASWYVQQQMPISYLPEDYFYCVEAQYTLLEKKTLLGYDIKVKNLAFNAAGEQLGPIDEICAQIVDADAGKTQVAPCFLPTFAAGPYWIVAFSVEEGWALVSGGPPKEQGDNGCRTGTGTNDSGFWIFTRQRQRDEAMIQKVRGIAQEKGFDLSVLKDVDHRNCGSSVIV